MKRIILSVILSIYALAGWTNSDKKTPDKTIEFKQLDTNETLRAYLWLPKDYQDGQKYKAIVLAHGCGGVHYKDDPDDWIAKYVAGKYKVWGKLLSDRGFIVLLEDSFTTRDENGNIGGGVCGSRDTLDRPQKIDPISVRAGDIASAIAYLKSRDDVIQDKVGVLGFSNGATSALALSNHKDLQARKYNLIQDGKKIFNIPFKDKYKANIIIALYPGCGINGYDSETQDIFINRFITYTDTYIFMASNDSVLPMDTKFRCNRLRIYDAYKNDDSTNMQVITVRDTDHQFDYYESDKEQVQKAIRRVIYLFESM